jgi:membrane protease YdiL (CAAX protease family)
LDPAQPAPINSREDAGVDLRDAGLVIAFAVVALFSCTFISEFIFSLVHRSQHLSPDAFVNAFSRNAFFQVPAEFAAYVLLMIYMAALVWRRHKTGLLQAIGWNAPGRRRILYALMTGATLALVADVGEIVLNPWIPQSLPITEYFRDRPSALLLGAFSILVAPLMEEIVFRGFIYPALARWTGVLSSIVVTALGFALLHGTQLGYSWALLLVIFVVGVALTVTRVVTKSVATCVIVHMAYNFVLFTQTYIQTHGFRHMQGV